MELTGRENIYLNGAILGMRKSEIARKFDEIVDFAEIEKFLDTPVKRYSSGMYVRLAFSIAAHLEPDILIVDEVLAVGDAEFQSKCLGKMKDVSSAQGRTVLFVTHNMASLESLCQRSILLQKGVVKAHGETKDMIKLYLQKQNNEKKEELVDRSDRSGKGGIRFTRLEFLSTKDEKLSALISGRTIKVRAHFQIYDNSDHNNCRIGVTFNRQAVPLFLLASELVSKQSVNIRKDGFFDFKIEQFPLSKGVYEIDLFLESNKEIQDWVISAGNIDVEDGDFYKGGRNYPIGWEGKTVLVNHEFFLYEN
jgi:lipopolysaccharide transport system ATP-binding protein